jgi:lactoylglutathione lyase
MHREIDNLVSRYDRGSITRRELVRRLSALVVGSPLIGQTTAAAERQPLFRARTLNHVTIITPEVARSKAFYQGLTGLQVRDEGKNFCELRLENGFLALYAPDEGHGPGLDHFCFGMEGFEPRLVFEKLKQAMPETHPTLEYGDQVYFRDPDGVRVQIADVRYKQSASPPHDQ